MSCTAKAETAGTVPQARVRAAHAEYLNHLMLQRTSGCGCATNLGALQSRFCPEGRRLRDAYNRAAAAQEAAA